MSRPARLVSAGAGSGKTYWIVEAVCRKVGEGLPLERVAAVTFTEAAAAELQDRIRARLLETPEHAHQAARVDAAAICTIHSFALALLKRYPLAAGLGPEPLTLEPSQSAALVRGLVAELLRDADVGQLRTLLEQGLGPGLGLSVRGFRAEDTPTGRLQDLVERVIEKARSLGMRAEALAAEGAAAADRLAAALGPAGDAARLRGAFERALDEALAFVRENPDAPTKSDLKLYAALTWAREALPAGTDWLDVAVRVAALGPDAYGKKKFRCAEALLAAAGAVACDHPAMRARLAACVRGVIDAAARVLARYEAEKQRIGALDFEDMQVAALDLLRGRGPAGAAYAPLVARALPFVVVDEFQDTSPLQFMLFEALRAHGAEVVYVGDLKQGIYGFRTADSALFAALLDEASARGAPHEELAVSRRSRPELVAFANDLFGAAMPPRGLPFAPLGVDNAYAAGRCPKAGPSLEVVRHPPTGRGVRQRAVLARLAAMIDGGFTVLDRATGAPRPARWGDVAVLAYRHDRLAEWSAALRARGVATVLDEGELFEALEVQLAHAWLRMLASPRDRAAAAAVLLSELYGVAQRTMVRMTLAGVVGSPARALELAARDPAALPLSPFERRALERCARDLSDGRRALRHLPLPEAVEAVLERVDLGLRLSLRADAERAARIRGNLRRLCEMAHALAGRAERPLALDGATGITLENFLVELDRARNEHHPQPAGEGGDDAVRLVTIHGSKGLEYPLVVLDVLHEKLEIRLPRVEVERPTDRATLLGPDALERSGLRLVPATAIPALAERLECLFDSEAAQRREWLRLLYVAVTRAREHLVLLWPEETKSASAVRRVKDLLVDAVQRPPAAAGEGAWVLRPGGEAHAVVVTSAPPGDDGEADGDAPAAAEPEAFARLRALVDGEPTAPEDTSPGAAAHPLEAAPPGSPAVDDAPTRAAAAPTRAAPSPRMALVTPTELCRVADCPEVPRLSSVHPDEHALARLPGGERATLADLPSSGAERAALAEGLEGARLGELLHQAVERADLTDPDGDPSRVAALLARRGVTDGAVASFLGRSLAAVRAALGQLDATELVGREVPFAIDLEGTVVRGAIDLVARSPAGLHVLDLKSHPLPRDAVPRWAEYYRPQLDTYALALARTTGERVAGRHLVLPAAGLLATLDEPFDPAHAAARAKSLTQLLATDARGPGPANDCTRCGWRNLCPRAEAPPTDDP